MPTCPAGHESATTDYCDECGAPMNPSPPSPPRTARHCPACGEVLEDGARFCEVCGHDSTKPAPAPAPWSVVATADRAWFAEVCRREGPDIATVTFPQYCPRARSGLSARRWRSGAAAVPAVSSPRST